MTIAVLGGTGPEGLGIAARLLAAGEEIAIGSRDPARANDAARVLMAEVPGSRAHGAINAVAAAAADLAIVAVPLVGLDGVLQECGPALHGKVVLDVVNALRLKGGVFEAVALDEGSVGALIRTRVPTARVVSGLKHESAAHLRAVTHRLEGDVLLCSDDGGARDIVADLIRRMPDLRPIDAGGLAVAPLLDHVTALLLNLNRRHGTETSLRIVGL